MTQQPISYQGNPMSLYLRSSLLFISVLSVTVIFGILMLIAALLPFALQYKLAAIWGKFVLNAAKVICGINYQITGLENISQQKNAIVLCKHQSAWETIALIALLPPQCILLKNHYSGFLFGAGPWLL